MTLDEFNVADFNAGTMFIYKGEKYPVAWIYFSEALIGLVDIYNNSNNTILVRCENVEIVE